MTKITVETKKQKGQSKVKSWIKDHTVELVVGTGALAIASVSFVFGINCGGVLVTNKFTEEIPNVINEMGNEGCNATMCWLRIHMPDMFEKIKDKMDVLEVQDIFYSRFKVQEALLSVKK